MDTNKTIKYALVDTNTNKVILMENSKKQLYLIGGRMNRKAHNKRVKIVQVVVTTEYIDI